MPATVPKPLRLFTGIGSWLLTVAITLVGLAALTFFIGRVLPIDPVLAIVGEKALPEVYQRVYLELGLDKPIWSQFGDYLMRLLRGDFGTSYATSRPVLTDLLNFFPATLELATIGLIIGVLLGVPMGVASAYWHEKWPDHLIRVVGLIGYSVPSSGSASSGSSSSTTCLTGSPAPASSTSSMSASSRA